ncbi:MAG: diaminopimelate epimerase [Desulfobacterales bacterium]|nr:diaminopimelate epimerase [Desulfobacterales bacterium]
MKKIPFVKYTLCGNKFVIVDEIKKTILTESEKPKFAFHATDIYYGVGSDNFLVVQPYNPKVLKSINDTNNYWKQLPDSRNSDYIFRMFEPDGSEAYSCGNGLMCISDYLYRRYGILSARVMTEIPTPFPKILTIGTNLQQNLNWSNMGHPGKIPREIINSSVTTPYDNKVETIKDIKIEFPSNELNVFKKFSSLTLSGFLVFTGEPHLVVFTDTGFSEDLSEHIFTLSPQTVSISKSDRSRIELSSRLVHQIGMAFNEDYPHYFPKGININFVHVLQNPGVIEFRCFERGINRETWACGTGAVAAAFIAKHLNMLAANEITLWPYLSRLRDHDAKLRVIKKENDYFLQGNSVFLFEGDYPFNENAKKISLRNQVKNHVQHSGEDCIQPPAEPGKNGKFLYEYSARLCKGIYPFEDIVNTIYHISARKSAGKEQDLYPEPVLKIDGKEPVKALRQTSISFSARMKLITGALILLILALGFNALLSKGSLDKHYLESLVSQYRIIGKDLQGNLQESLLSAKNIRNIRGMNKILEQAKNRIVKKFATEEIPVSVSIALADGSVHYSTDTKFVGATLPEKITLNYEEDKKKSSLKNYYTKFENNYITALPLRDDENKPCATVVIAFGEKQIKDIHNTVFNKNVITITIIITCSAIILILCNAVVLKRYPGRIFPRKKIFTLIFLTVILSQIIFSGLNINLFKNHYLQLSSQDNAVVLNENIFARLQEIILDSLTVLIISIFFFVEMLILILQYMERQFETDEMSTKVRPEAIRPAVFLLLFGFNISVSFVPLHMETLYEPILNLSRDTIMGLPISVKMLTTGFAFFIAGVWFDKRGWHEPFITGLFLAGTGVFCSALASNALYFLIFQGIAGMGYGLSLMSAQGFVVLYMDKTKAQGIARLGAGTLAGHISGAAAGAMLAERIGYRPVFIVGSVIVFFVIVYTAVFMRNAIRKPEDRDSEQSAQPFNIGQTLHFIFDIKILALLLFSIIPTYIGMIGFLNYFCPVYLHRLGVSQSSIGRVLMIDGFSLIYIAPLISKYIDRSRDKKKYIVIGGILGSLAFISFYFTEGLAAAVVAAFFLGLSTSFNTAAQIAYVTELKITQGFGEGKALGILRSLGRSGQVLGPIVFSWIIVSAEINSSMASLGIFYVFITILFLFMSQKGFKTVK